jgi:hypothetical protein
VTNDPRPTPPTSPTQSTQSTGPRASADETRAAWPPTDATPAPTPAPVGPAAVRGKRGGGTIVNGLLGVALVVAIGGVAFGVGRATAPVSAAAAGRTGFGGGFGAGGGPTASGAPNGGGVAGAGGVSIQGTVTAIAADSITLQLPSGQSVTIPTTTTTTYHERTAATAADVTSGATVIVQLEGGRGGFGQGGGQGGPAASGAPTASGTPARGLGSASTVTVVPAGS